MSLVSLIAFPWQLTALLTLIVGYWLPVFPLIVAALAELLYYPGYGMPHILIYGAIGSLFMYLVRSFVKTRIM